MSSFERFESACKEDRYVWINTDKIISFNKSRDLDGGFRHWILCTEDRTYSVESVEPLLDDAKVAKKVTTR